MSRLHAIAFAAVASLLLSQPALMQPAWARTGAEIAALFNSGVAAYDAGDYQKAYKIWWDLRYEDIAAMRNLGMMLRKGQGVEKNPGEAKDMLLRAARAGLPTAQADLADMLLKGEGGKPDLAAALPLLQAAAAAHHPVAQFQLGQLYETGAPPLVPQNLDVARQLYTAAAERGVSAAAERLRVVGPPSTNSATATPGTITPTAATQASTPAVMPDGAAQKSGPAPAPAP